MFTTILIVLGAGVSFWMSIECIRPVRSSNPYMG
jgi:hypothetical protein